MYCNNVVFNSSDVNILDFLLDWQKEPCPVAAPLHILDHLIVSEVNNHHPQLAKNSTHSVMVSISIFFLLQKYSVINFFFICHL